MENHMSSRLYCAAEEGCIEYLEVDTQSEDRRRMTCNLLSLTHEENNCLHIAARFGHEKFMRRVLSLCPSLLYQQNKRGDNPLHIAARAGHLHIVKLLTGSFQSISQNTRRTGNRAIAREAEEGENRDIAGADLVLRIITREEDWEGENRTLEWPSLPVWRTQNQDRNTALHEALRSKHEDVALHLLDLEITDNCETVILVVNAMDESPLYLAAEAGFVHVLTKILEILTAGGHVNALLHEKHIAVVGPKGQTPLHASVLARSPESIYILHNSFPGLVRKQDSYGKTALYYATQEHDRHIIDELLRLDDYSAYICDSEGLSPLLVAASMGHGDSIRTILRYCPASIESSDNNGHNALHLAVTYNTSERFKKLLSIHAMMALIDEPDKEGNTPLHLATMAQKYWHVCELLYTGRVDLTAKNNDGNTALDLCLLDGNPSYRQKLIRWKLKRRKASRGRARPLMLDEKSVITKKDKTEMKEVINTLSVVAALLATITFAAPFAIPGGYKGDGPDGGSPELIHMPALKVFLVSDTIGLCCSIWALLVLIAAASDDTILEPAIVRSKLLLAVSLYTAMIAFFSGLYAVVRIESTLVAILVCIIGSTLGSHFVPDTVTGLLTNLIPWFERLRQFYSDALELALLCLDTFAVILVSPLLYQLVVSLLDM